MHKFSLSPDTAPGSLTVFAICALKRVFHDCPIVYHGEKKCYRPTCRSVSFHSNNRRPMSSFMSLLCSVVMLMVLPLLVFVGIANEAEKAVSEPANAEQRFL